MPALVPARVALLSYSPAANQTWTGAAAAVTITATSGSFTPGDVTWVGTEGTALVTATSGSWVPGSVTWVGTDGTVTIIATSGAFIQLIAAGYVCLTVAAEYNVSLTVSEDC